MSRDSHSYSLKSLCEAAGYSRQGYRQALKHKVEQKAVDELVLAKVREIKKIQPNLGGIKLHHELHREGDARYHIGRDRLFELLWQHGLLIERKRNGRRTTNSNHWYGYAPNLLYDMPQLYPNQIWVSDITYIRTRHGFGYLALIMDAFSRRIIGWNYSGSLSHEGALDALKMACRTAGDTMDVIHHSDRGIQYASKPYRKYLQKRGIFSSMTEKDHVYENAAAERLNGILKHELGLSATFRHNSHAKYAIGQAVKIYNTQRPHQSLDYHYPDEIYYGYSKKNEENAA